jgi:hypothetical protein
LETSATRHATWHEARGYGENMWAAVKAYLDAVTDQAAEPVIAKYTGVLAAADVFTASTTLWVMESIRLDLGYGSQVHP